MRNNKIVPIVIMSAEIASNSAELNKILSDDLEKSLSNSNEAYKAVQGCYKGVKEKSYVVVPKNEERALEDLINLSETYGQECILYRDSTGRAWLCGKGGRDLIGMFSQVPRSVAIGSDNYTYDIENNGYYIVEDL